MRTSQQETSFRTDSQRRSSTAIFSRSCPWCDRVSARWRTSPTFSSRAVRGLARIFCSRTTAKYCERSTLCDASLLNCHRKKKQVTLYSWNEATLPLLTIPCRCPVGWQCPGTLAASAQSIRDSPECLIDWPPLGTREFLPVTWPLAFPSTIHPCYKQNVSKLPLQRCQIFKCYLKT